jgi:hypothetical protein
MLKEINIKELIPNNFYINELKLNSIRKAYNTNSHAKFPPVLVGMIGEEYALLDGHSRVMGAFEQGLETIIAQVYKIDEIEGPTDLYIAIHNKAKEMGLNSIESLKSRKVDNEEHKKLWVEYCEKVMTELKNRDI